MLHGKQRPFFLAFFEAVTYVIEKESKIFTVLLLKSLSTVKEAPLSRV